nr:hypothetical protein [Tanacetum cinerariifolium]
MQLQPWQASGLIIVFIDLTLILSEPELQVPFSSVGIFEGRGHPVGDVGNLACSLYDYSTIETTSINNVSVLNASSLGESYGKSEWGSTDTTRVDEYKVLPTGHLGAGLPGTYE